MDGDPKLLLLLLLLHVLGLTVQAAAMSIYSPGTLYIEGFVNLYQYRYYSSQTHNSMPSDSSWIQ